MRKTKRTMTTVGNLFHIRYGHSLELNRLPLADDKNGIAFVSRKMGDNGISAFVQPVRDLSPAPAGEVTVALSGNGVLSAFLQERPFYTGYHVAILSPKEQMSKPALLYYCMCIRANHYRYSYGRQANRSLATLLLPPVNELPKWVSTAKVNQFKGSDAPLKSGEVALTDSKSWKHYSLNSLFKIKKGKRLTAADMVSGTTPYIGAIDSNNGVSALIGQKPIHDANTITVNYNGSVGEAFYQPVAFWATDDANVLYPRFKLTPSIAMFLIAVIRHETYRFNYGRKWNKRRMEQSSIKLPSADSGKPDWRFMENYINGLSYSGLLRSEKEGLE
jgi:hypothetical protein